MYIYAYVTQQEPRRIIEEAVEPKIELSSKDLFNRGTNTLRYLQ